jgi:predicted RNA-binding Zn-ribbon protein involved in translation (DUF1610 family)
MPAPPPLEDPGRLIDPAALHVTEDTRTYPCPSCGGMLVFHPDSQALKCIHCGNGRPISPQFAQPGPVAKRDLGRAMQELAVLVAQQPTTLEKEVVCQSCGGRTLFAGTLTAVRCPYCNTPIQRDDVQAAHTRLPLDGVLPLHVSEQKAREQIEAWINGRWFAPNEFKKYRELGSFTSIYLAYFDYDAATRTHYTGMRGVNRYVTVRDGDQTRTEVRTDWYPASGTVDNTFIDVTGLANSGLDEHKVQELEPWPMDLLRPYSPEYVAGHLSRTYDQDAGQVFEARVRGRLEGVIESTVRSDIGGDQQRVNSMDVNWLSLTFNHLALPVWMLTVTYRSRPFNVFINGVTGEVQGQRPWSAVKITLMVLLGVAILITFILLYQYFGGGS